MRFAPVEGIAGGVMVPLVEVQPGEAAGTGGGSAAGLVDTEGSCCNRMLSGHICIGFSGHRTLSYNRLHSVDIHVACLVDTGGSCCNRLLSGHTCSRLSGHRRISCNRMLSGHTCSRLRGHTRLML